jgi:hypothetical protein
MRSRVRIAVCIKNDCYEASLETGKFYRVVADPDAEELGHFRIVDEGGEDFDYPADRFFLLQDNSASFPFPRLPSAESGQHDAKGVDLLQIRANMRLTPTERARQADRARRAALRAQAPGGH